MRAKRRKGVDDLLSRLWRDGSIDGPRIPLTILKGTEGNRPERWKNERVIAVLGSDARVELTHHIIGKTIGFRFPRVIVRLIHAKSGRRAPFERGACRRSRGWRRR